MNKIIKTTKVFKSGNSQAVIIPKKLEFKSKEVEIFKRKNEVIIREKSKNKSPLDVKGVNINNITVADIVSFVHESRKS